MADGGVVGVAVWPPLVVATVVAWSATSLPYKAGVRDADEPHVCLRCSACIGLVFLVIAAACLAMREEPLAIWESAVRFWPMTLCGLLYVAISTVSLKGSVRDEASVEPPVERAGSGMSTTLLAFAFLALGRADPISEVPNAPKAAGIVPIVACVAVPA